MAQEPNFPTNVEVGPQPYVGLFPRFGFVLLDNYMVIDTSGSSYSTSGDPQWLRPDVAVVDVDSNDLAPSVREQLGKTFTIYTAQGESRTVTIGAFRILSILQEDEVLAEAREKWGDSTTDHPLTTEEFWKLGSSHFLVADFEEFAAAGNGYLLQVEVDHYSWARAASLKAPKLADGVMAPKDMEKIEKKIRASPEYNENNEEYLRYVRKRQDDPAGSYGFPSDWWGFGDAQSSSFTLGKSEISFHSLLSKSDCGGESYNAKLDAVYLKNNGKYVHVAWFPPDVEVPRVSLIDLIDYDGDGGLEAIFTDRFEKLFLLRLLPDGQDNFYGFRIPFDGPGC